MFEKMSSAAKIGTVEIRNRFIMPAMKSDMTSPDRKVTQTLIDYYTERAKGGFGLLITEYCLIDPSGAGIPHQLSCYDDVFIPGLKKLTQSVHDAGAKMFMQLHHAGRSTMEEVTGMPTVAPSAIASPIFGTMPRALTIEEIRNLIQKYISGAVRAQKSGFDGVEVQCGHGYLIGQFLSPFSNKRTDEYGGNLNGRMQFGLEVLRGIKEACGSDFPVSIRISGQEHVAGGTTIEDSMAFARACEQNGADAIHVSTGSMDSLEYLCAPTNIPNGFNLPDVAAVKRAVSIPVIGVGRIVDPAMAEAAVTAGTCDFVAFGRASIADPHLPKKAMAGEVDDICPCVGCLTRCWGIPGIDGDTRVSCMMDPFTGHESSLQFHITQTPKNIVIVGAGPAGLETAWIAALRGHKVTVLEKEDHCGGQLWLASIAPGKTDFARATKFHLTMCNKYGVDIRLNTEADAETVKALNPDKVILATGAVPTQIPLNVRDNLPVVNAFDVLSGKKTLKGKVLVIGGGMVGLETAEYAASLNHSTAIVEMLNAVGNGLTGAHLQFILQNLETHHVEIYTQTGVKSLGKDGIICTKKNGTEVTLEGFDMVVTAVGTKAYNPLEAELKEIYSDLCVIGDAQKPSRAYAAIEEGARLALTI